MFNIVDADKLTPEQHKRATSLIRFGYATEANAAAKVLAETQRKTEIKAQNEAKAKRSAKQVERARLRGKDGRFDSLGTCSFCKGPLGVDWYGRTDPGSGVRVQCCEGCAD